MRRSRATLVLELSSVTGDCERALREKLLSFANGFDVEMDGEKLKMFSSIEAVFHTFSVLARGEDFAGAVGVGGGAIRFALRDVRRGEGVCGM